MKNTILVGVILFIVGTLVGLGADRVYLKRKSTTNYEWTGKQAGENSPEAMGTSADGTGIGGGEGGGTDMASIVDGNKMPGGIAGPSLTGQTQISTGKNSIFVEDQKPGNTVAIQSLALGTDGWVVIHDDKGGAPGHILGAHRFNTGTYIGQNVELLQETEGGKVYYAMLHTDDGDKKFDYRVDLPVKDETGNPLMMRFIATDKSAQ